MCVLAFTSVPESTALMCSPFDLLQPGPKPAPADWHKQQWGGDQEDGQDRGRHPAVHGSSPTIRVNHLDHF